MKKIVVFAPLSLAERDTFAPYETLANFVFAPAGLPDPSLLTGANACIGAPSPSFFAKADALEWLQLTSAGADAYCKPGVLSSAVQLTNATGAYGLSVAEHMLAGILSMMKNLPQYRDRQAAHTWRDCGTAMSLTQATVVILGAGDIGGTLARMLRALGAYVICVRRTVREKPDFCDEVYTNDRLNEVLPRADVLAMALPESADSVHILNAQRLALLKPTALVANAGRGSAIDLDALTATLTAGRLRGAFLDVTQPEPLPADHPLWDLSNCVITPHAAGGFHLTDTQHRIACIAAENIGHYLRGEPLRNIVDRTLGYAAQ